MPYDPRMLQMVQTGIGMMGPQSSPFPDPSDPRDPRNQTKRWWDPAVQVGQPANRAVNVPDSQSADRSKQPQPSLLQLLMLGGQPTYSGPPSGGAAPAPWQWPGGMGLPGGTRRGNRTPGY